LSPGHALLSMQLRGCFVRGYLFVSSSSFGLWF
jgi:hypothetical protein